MCWRDVVAPPISRGSSSLERSSSRATVDHLVERRRDQPGEPDHVDPLALGRLENRRGRHHHAEVDHLVVVAAEHDADDVLADVVHVALDGREQDLALRAAAAVSLGLHERLQIRHGTLHHACRLDDLRQEHPAGAEQVADNAHAVHQRPLDHVERAVGRLARLLDVGLDEVDDAAHERMLQPTRDRLLAPREIELAAHTTALDALGELDEPFRRVGPAVEDHVLDVLEQLGLDVLVDGELPGVDDAQVEAGAAPRGRGRRRASPRGSESLPRNEKLRFEIPPEVREPGHRCLINGRLSMNARA